MAKAKHYLPEGHGTVTPTLTIEGAAEALDWYKKAFNATEIDRAVGPDGKIMHAEIKIGSSILMVSDAMMGSQGPKGHGGSPVGFYIYVEDCDRLFQQATAAGATVTMPMSDMFWGDRFGKITDPFGHHWGIATHTEDLTPEEMGKRQKDWEAEFARQQHGK